MVTVAQDTLRIRADGPPLWGENVVLEEDLVVAGVSGSPEYAFQRIAHIAVDDSGNFYLFNGIDSQIRRYDHTGKFVRTVGRVGRSVGEYENVVGMTVDVTGSLVVFTADDRVTHFARDGNVVKRWTSDRMLWSEFSSDVAGVFYFKVPIGPSSIGRNGPRFQYVRHSSGGVFLDSLPIPEYVPRPQSGMYFYSATSDGERSNFAVENLSAPYLPGGVVTAASSSYRFIIDDGDRISVIERTANAVPLGREERAQWQEWADTVRRVRQGAQYQIPRVKPFIRSIRSDERGRIWVEVYVAAERRRLPATRPNGSKQILFWRERASYDVFARTGTYLGRITLPQETILLTIKGDRLYTLTREAHTEPRLVVYRLPPSSQPE